MRATNTVFYVQNDYPRAIMTLEGIRLGEVTREYIQDVHGRGFRYKVWFVFGMANLQASGKVIRRHCDSEEEVVEMLKEFGAQDGLRYVTAESAERLMVMR